MTYNRPEAEALERVRGVADELDREAERGNLDFKELRQEIAKRIRSALDNI